MLIITAGSATYNMSLQFSINYVFTYPLNNTFTKDLSKMKTHAGDASFDPVDIDPRYWSFNPDIDSKNFFEDSISEIKDFFSTYNEEAKRLSFSGRPSFVPPPKAWIDWNSVQQVHATRSITPFDREPADSDDEDYPQFVGSDY